MTVSGLTWEVRDEFVVGWVVSSKGRNGCGISIRDKVVLGWSETLRTFDMNGKVVVFFKTKPRDKQQCVMGMVSIGSIWSKGWWDEENGEHLSWNTQGLVNNTGVEIDVWMEFSLDEIFVGQCDSFELHSDVYEWTSSSLPTI